jgi:DNA-binding protein YbaB
VTADGAYKGTLVSVELDGAVKLERPEIEDKLVTEDKSVSDEKPVKADARA